MQLNDLFLQNIYNVSDRWFLFNLDNIESLSVERSIQETNR